jgi:hypothetical protein
VNNLILQRKYRIHKKILQLKGGQSEDEGEQWRVSYMTSQLFSSIRSFNGFIILIILPRHRQLAPFHFDEAQVHLSRDNYTCSIVEFPIKYPSIPFALGKLPRVALQLLVDRASGGYVAGLEGSLDV